MDDQLYPQIDDAATNQLLYAQEDGEIVDERQVANGIIASSYPIMDDVAKWFQASIEDCDSISNIEMVEMTVNGVKYTRSVSIEGQVLAYQLLKQLLQDKKGEWGEFGETET